MFRSSAAILIFLLWGMSAVAADQDRPWFLSLEGNHKFRLEDDPRFAAPEFDDSDWQTVVVPLGWRDQGIPAKPYVGWYRFHFIAPAELRNLDPGLQVGPCGLAYEVFLNGDLVGTVGKIDEYHMWGEEWRERIFSLPPELLRIGEGNVIAMRVQRLVGTGGIAAGPFGIGDDNRLREERLSEARVVIAVESAFLVFYASTLLFSIMLWVLGFRDLPHLWFGVVILLIGVNHFLDSYLLDVLWGLSYPISVVSVLIGQSFMIATLLFFKYSLQLRLRRASWLVLTIYTALCVGWWWNIDTKDLLYIPVAIVSVVGMGPLVWAWCANGIRRGHPDAWPLMIGAVSLSIISGVLLFPHMYSANSPWGAAPRIFVAPVDWYAWLSLHLCMIYTLAAGYARTQHRLRSTSQRILAAHEEERGRLAHELHDGVGQSLAGLQTRLESLSGDEFGLTNRGVTGQLVDQATSVIDELHRVAVDLHPLAVREAGLLEAVRQFALDVQARTGVDVAVHEEGVVNRHQRSDAHLYRVIQEAVNNAVRHGGARDVEVSLRDRDDYRIIEVRDNGSGFDAARLLDPQGLGLAAMRERAELLGGWLRVSSRPGGGTRVVLELPPSTGRSEK